MPLREVLESWDAGAWGEPADPEGSGVSVLRSTNFRSGGQLSFENQTILSIDERTYEKKKLNYGDILLERSGGGPLQPVGRVAGFWEVNNEKKFICGNFISRLVPKRRIIDSLYLLYTLNFWHLRGDTEKFQTATTGIRNLQMKQYLDHEIHVPSPPEQRQIAARLKAQLAEVETARQAAQVQIQEAEALRAAVYRDAFRQVVPVAVPPAFEDAPQGWQWRKLADIARLESGHTPSRQRPDWWGGDVSWISLTEIRALDGQWVQSTQLRTNDAGIANSAARILPRGTVCYSRTASVGFVAIMAAPMATSQDFANWVCGDELEPEFLMHALIRARKELRELATGATHKTIYMPTLGAFHVCLPSRQEQQHIVHHLKAQLVEVGALHHVAAERLAEIERLPQRILAHAFEN
jgi:type I restriction enzyme S subunit